MAIGYTNYSGDLKRHIALHLVVEKALSNKRSEIRLGTNFAKSKVYRFKLLMTWHDIHSFSFKLFACLLTYLINKLILFNITTMGLIFSLNIDNYSNACTHVFFKGLIFRTTNFQDVHMYSSKNSFVGQPTSKKKFFFMKTNRFKSYFMYDVNVNRHLLIIKESLG